MSRGVDSTYHLLLLLSTSAAGWLAGLHTGCLEKATVYAGEDQETAGEDQETAGRRGISVCFPEDKRSRGKY